ncbi:hypothetical protein [Prescottella equi]|uniref:hypothetical protein n=1 Tax=Rhodococcus hoagii TaxID=43767 RepID=UPI0011A8FBEE|nr:hypothetical protein [Prescottella equi]
MIRNDIGGDRGSRHMNGWRVLLGVVVGAALVGCGSGAGEDGPPAPVTTSSSAAGTTSSQTPVVESPPPTASPEPVKETAEDPASPVVAQSIPVITSCQDGMGPIETYWSDGTVTGYSDYCQAQHHAALAAEVEANRNAPRGQESTYTPLPQVEPKDEYDTSYRCTNRIDYAGDPRSNAEINSIGAATGYCPEPIN